MARPKGAVTGAVGASADGLSTALRAGTGWRWAWAHVAADHWARTFAVSLPNDVYGGAASLTATTIGLEAGPAWRPRDWLELRAGGGVHWLTASVEKQVEPLLEVIYLIAIPKSAVVGSLYGSVVYLPGPLTRHGLRGRLGLEARLLLGGDLRLDAFDRTERNGAAVHLTVGLELPLRW